MADDVSNYSRNNSLESNSLTWNLKPQIENIPPELATSRWCNWKAQPGKNGRIEKVPYNNGHKVSTREPGQWISLPDAEFNQVLGNYSGLGLLVQHGLIATDLDHCIHDGQLAPWAAAVVDLLDSYTELSPSGTGLHILGRGLLAEDFTNRELGLEVYGGNSPRYVTITGHVWGEKKPFRTIPPETLQTLAMLYQESASKPAQAPQEPMPALLPWDVKRELSEATLEPDETEFLRTGVPTYRGPDKDSSVSGWVPHIARRLFQQSWTPAQVLDALWRNEHIQFWAIDKRGGSYEKGQAYLWHNNIDGVKHHYQPSVTEVFSALPQPEPPPVAEHTRWVEAQIARRDQRKASRRPYELATLADLWNDTRAAPWMVKGLMHQQDVACVYGESSSLKSFWAQHLACCIATGRPFFGQEVLTPGPVVYLAGEGEEGLKKRFRGWWQEHGRPGEVSTRIALSHGALDLSALPETDPITQVQLAADRVFDMVDRKAFQMRDMPALIVVDTMNTHLPPGADENSAKDVGPFLRRMKALAQRYGCGVLIVHHVGKRDKATPRGSEAITNNTDVAWLMDKKTSGVVSIVNPKQKDTEESAEQWISARKVWVENWRNRHGEEYFRPEDDNSTLVLELSTREDRQKGVEAALGSVQRRILEAARSYWDQHQQGEISRIVLRDLSADPNTGRKSRSDHFSDVLTVLEKRGLVRIEGDFVLPPRGRFSPLAENQS